MPQPQTAQTAQTTPGPEWDSCKVQLENWRELANKRRDEHTNSVGWRQFWGTLIGIPTTMLSTVVGTAVFTSWQQNTQLSDQAKAWLAGLSITAALLTALQAFFRLSERAARHQTQANQSHALCSEIDLLLVCPPQQSDLSSAMNKVKDQIAALGTEASGIRILRKLKLT